MELKELKKLLQEPYKTNNWRTLLGHVFEYVQFLDNPIVIPTGDARVNQLKQYGTVRLSDGKNLALFELTLNDNVNLIRNRVGLNELVKKYIDQDSYHGILSIFEQGKEDYRFTFTARNTEFDEDQGFIDKDTDTKRFTYILGANESCRTAAERFDALSKTDNKDIKAVEDAFNVEKLSKKFFKEYIEQFDVLVTYLKSKPTYFQAIFKNDETATRNFVKRFMGRLVFLKFIQKKGWLGVPVSETGWNHGDYQFLEEQFKNFENKGLFVSQFLNPLFFEALNVGNRPNDEFQTRGYKIPYLSGGLFDNDNPKENRIDFEERELTNLFDFFERYNFTIDENDLHDKEVGIDPEMLGHIFENLLEDNKDKGAFYTPKEIVRYMCQESLKEYLKTYLEKEKLWPTDETTSQNLTNTIAAFVEKKETAAILRYDKELATALRDVKICDPAIGSGAFPMGLLNEIFTMIKNLHDESPDRVGDVWNMEGKKWQPNIVKQNIIQNSIYGVDIEAGAVDIARLRFWLSLIIEETEPKPLPHLDYKIVVGNSLVSKLEDTIIDIEWDLKPQLVQADIFGNEGKVTQKRELIREITALQKQVFEPDSDEEKLSIAIRNKKIDLLVLQLEIMIDEKGVTDKPQGTGRNITSMTQKWLETKGWQQQIAKLKIMKKGIQTPLEFFDWLLDFPEVMNPEVNKNPGFDIVIGNPPYVSIRNQDIETREVLKNYYKYSGGSDIYVAFIEKAFNLKKNTGSIILIIPNKFFGANYGTKIRKELNRRYSISHIWDLKDIKVFESAQISTIVFGIVEKRENLKCKIKTEKGFVRKDQLFDLDNKIQIESNDEEQFLINHLNSNYEKLDKVADIRTGIVGFEYWKMKEIITNEGIINANNLKIYTNGNFKRYSDNWESEIKLYKEEYKKPTLKLDEDYLSDNTIEIFKTRPKIIVRGVCKRVSAFLDVDGSAMLVAVHSILPKNEDHIYNLLGIINSNLINWYHLKVFYSIRIPQGSLKYPISFFDKIPVPNILNNKKLTDLVKNLRNKLNYDEDIIEIDYKIDNLVYKLYNLTYEEACIVEPELPARLTKAAYKAIEI